jgi:DNA-directed RNA polymerase specialized sigma24 family protein
MYVAGHSYREIAVVLGTTEGAVRTALRDIRKRLREMVGEDLDGFGGDS